MSAPTPESTPRHRVVALVQAPLSTFELACAAEVFGIDRPGLAGPYRFVVCTSDPGPVQTRAGYDLLVTAGLEAMRDADTVVIAGWPLDLDPTAELTDAVANAHRRGARIVALCSGAFLLAATGLLDGRTATTHWRMAAEMTGRYPAVCVDPRVLYVDLGDVATSAGTAAAIDLCLHLVRKDHGASYAGEVARHMVMPPHRDGGQTQFIGRLPAPSPSGLAELTEWALRHLSRPLRMEDLALRAGQSTRTLNRRFQDELGTTPGQWLLSQRLQEACRLLEDTDLTVDAIAGQVGLSSEGNLRRRFKTELDTLLRHTAGRSGYLVSVEDCHLSPSGRGGGGPGASPLARAPTAPATRFRRRHR